MSMNPAAIATARRNLAHRITRLLDKIEGENREPNRIEGDCVSSALTHLAVEQWPHGEQAMLRAERAEKARPKELANVRAAHEPFTIKHLRGVLAQIMITQSKAG
jgi:hypothetical protein